MHWVLYLFIYNIHFSIMDIVNVLKYIITKLTWEITDKNWNTFCYSRRLQIVPKDS